MENKRNWRIVQTKRGVEKKVCEQLKKKEIEHYLPLCKSERKWNERSRVIIQPLFDQYIFVNISPEQCSGISKLEGVKGWIYFRDQKACINPAEINMIRRFIHEHNEIKLEKIRVQVADTPGADRIFTTYEPYKIVALHDNLEKIVLPCIGYALVAEKVQAKVDVIRIGSPKFYFQNLFNSSYR